MAKHSKIERAPKVASVFVPISRGGLSKKSRGQDWRKDLLMSWLFQTCIRMQTSLDRRFLRFGMTVQEASVLLRCVEARSITPGQLAIGLGRDKGMITRFVKRLEQSSLLARDINQRDRRFADLKPTAKGKRVARELAAVFYQVRRELFVGISESDVQRLSNMLALLHRNAGDLGSQQKCTAVRRRRRIGVHGVKAAITLSSQPPLVADILQTSLN